MKRVVDLKAKIGLVSKRLFCLEASSCIVATIYYYSRYSYVNEARLPDSCLVVCVRSRNPKNLAAFGHTAATPTKTHSSRAIAANSIRCVTTQVLRAL